MPITRTPIIDDDNTGTTGTPLNNAWKQEFYNQIDAMGGVTNSPTVPTSGPITSLPLPAGGGDQVIYLNNASLSTIHGITPGLPNQRVTLISVGAGRVDLVHVSGTAGTVNMRLLNWATSAPTSLAPGTGVATYCYDGILAGLWRLVDHEQGALITPPYAASAFTGSAGTWTVDAGDVGTYAYKLDGRNLKVWFSLSATSVAAAGAGLNIALPLGYVSVSSKTVVNPFFYNDNGSITTLGQTQVDPSTTVIRLLKIGFANWIASTHNTAVFGLADIEIV